MWDFMTESRGDEVHTDRVKTIKETEAVPADDLSPAASNPYYSTYYFRQAALYSTIFPAVNETGDALLEEKKKLGLPTWCNAWTFLDTHYVELDGDRVKVVDTCEQYLTLLDRLIHEFEEALWT